MKRILSSLALAVAAFAATASPVQGTFTLTGFAQTPALSGTVVDGFTPISAGIGQLNATFDDGTGFGADPFSVYCIELHASAPNFGAGTAYTENTNPALGTFGNPFTSLQEGRLQKLFTKEYVANGSTNPANSVESAAMQLAIWEILTETSSSLSLSSGTFWAAGTIGGATAKANTLLSGLDSYSTTGYNFAFTSFNNGGNKAGYQDFLAVNVTPGDSCSIGNSACDVPEPTSLALAGLGLFGIFGLSRKTAKVVKA